MKHVILAFLTLVWTASPALAQGCHEPKGSTQPQAQGAEPRGLPPAAAGPRLEEGRDEGRTLSPGRCGCGLSGCPEVGCTCSGGCGGGLAGQRPGQSTGLGGVPLQGSKQKQPKEEPSCEYDFLQTPDPLLPARISFKEQTYPRPIPLALIGYDQDLINLVCQPESKPPVTTRIPAVATVDGLGKGEQPVTITSV